MPTELVFRVSRLRAAKPCRPGWRAFLRAAQGRLPPTISLAWVASSVGIREAAWTVDLVRLNDAAMKTLAAPVAPYIGPGSIEDDIAITKVETENLVVAASLAAKNVLLAVPKGDCHLLIDAANIVAGCADLLNDSGTAVQDRFNKHFIEVFSRVGIADLRPGFDPGMLA